MYKSVMRRREQSADSAASSKWPVSSRTGHPALRDGAPGSVGAPSAAVPVGTARERQLPRDAGARLPTQPWAGPRLFWPSLTHTSHAGHVQLEAIEAVTGVALPDAHAAPILTAIQDPTLLSLQPLEALVEA